MPKSEHRSVSPSTPDRAYQRDEAPITLRRILEAVLPFLALCAAIWLLEKLAEIGPG